MCPTIKYVSIKQKYLRRIIHFRLSEDVTEEFSLIKSIIKRTL